MKGKPNRMGYPIDILPPKDAVLAAAPASYVPLVFGGGPILSQPVFTAFFWGPFQQVQIDGMLAYLQGFASYLSDQGAPAGSEDVLRQYGVTGGLGTLNLQVSTAPAQATDGDVQQMVLNLQNQGLLPPFSSQRLFLIFTMGIQFNGYGTQWCAYHGTWGPGCYYAICPFPSAGGCGSGDPITSWQSVTSHEIMEAATDPGLGSGWTEQGEEGGDVCAWQEVALPFGTVQRFADNRQQACSVWTVVKGKEKEVQKDRKDNKDNLKEKEKDQKDKDRDSIGMERVRDGADLGEEYRQLAERIDNIEQRLASGQAFITPAERPEVGAQVLQQSDHGQGTDA
jgi:hypothetical protein